MKERLAKLKTMMENHQQDVKELGYVIKGLEKQIKE